MILRAALAGVVGCWLGCLAGCAAGDEVIARGAMAAQFDSRSFHGVEASALGGVHGVSVGVDAFGGVMVRRTDPSQHGDGGIDLVTRVSLLGLLSHDHRVERWVDVGGEAGAGGGFTPTVMPASFGHVWGGGWVEIGLWTGRAYPVLLLEVRRTSSTSPWDDDTVWSIGLGTTRRTTTTDSSWFRY